MRVVISEFMEQEAVDALAARHETLFDPELVESRMRLLATLGQTQALLIRNRTQVDAQLLEAAPELRVVGRLGVGLDNVDVAACRARGVEVIPAIGANAQAVAEYVICTAMMLLRGAYLHSAMVARGEWPRTALTHGREIAGKRLGIMGFGNIGRRVGELGAALGMQVYACTEDSAAEAPENVRFCSLDELVSTSDVISLHLPVTDATRGMFDRARLLQMKQGAVLINPARGGIVDEPALAELLLAGHIGGAALDVFAEEPLSADTSLRDVPNLILTPHIAGLSAESNRRVSDMIAERVADALDALG